jgi:hypothetical protein
VRRCVQRTGPVYGLFCGRALGSTDPNPLGHDTRVGLDPGLASVRIGLESCLHVWLLGVVEPAADDGVAELSAVQVADRAPQSVEDGQTLKAEGDDDHQHRAAQNDKCDCRTGPSFRTRIWPEVIVTADRKDLVRTEHARTASECACGQTLSCSLQVGHRKVNRSMLTAVTSLPSMSCGA